MTAESRDELLAMSVLEMAARIVNGDVSSAETVEAHIERIEEVDPRLNAVVVKCCDEARAAARSADDARKRSDALGALHGVPVSICISHC